MINKAMTNARNELNACTKKLYDAINKPNSTVAAKLRNGVIVTDIEIDTGLRCNLDSVFYSKYLFKYWFLNGEQCARHRRLDIIAVGTINNLKQLDVKMFDTKNNVDDEDYDYEDSEDIYRYHREIAVVGDEQIEDA